MADLGKGRRVMVMLVGGQRGEGREGVGVSLEAKIKSPGLGTMPLSQHGSHALPK